MLRFLASIILVQAATVALVMALDPVPGGSEAWWPMLLALGIIALVAAFWLSSLSGHLRREQVERLREGFAREREDLRVKAEREKTRIVRESHKTIEKRTRRTEARANLKVGVAFTAAAAAGLLMMLTSFVTLGLLTITGAGGALGGWLLHRHQAGKAAAMLPEPGDARHRKWLPGYRSKTG